MFRKVLNHFTPLLLLLSVWLMPLRAAWAQGVPEGFNAGPDIITGDIGEIGGLEQFGSSGTQVGLGVSTTSCNAGNMVVNFFALPATNHPLIPHNLYRMSGGAGNNDRFEQIGQSWVKHAFGADQQSVCFTCQPGGDGNHLGVGCSDTYANFQNAAQNDLGSRALINPFTGAFQNTANNHSGHSHTGTSHRILVEGSDLNTSLNPGATYYAEVQYISSDEYAWCQGHAGQCNMYNNASYIRYDVSGTTTFTFSQVGSVVRMLAAVNAWTGATINPIEPEPGVDGRAFIAYKVTGPVAGVYHYEYAIYNENLDRGIQSFSIPLGCAITLSNLGFHAPLNHPGFSNDGTLGGLGFSNAPWTSSQTTDAVSWSSETIILNQNANAIRWGTLYNFRFDSNKAPIATNATIGFFKTGTPVTVGILGPNACDVAPSPSPTATASPPPSPTPTPPMPTPTPAPTPTPPSTPTPFPTPILPPGGNGKIAFHSNRNFKGGDIWVIHPDGSNPTDLTNSPSPTEDIDPAWSPDGNKIAFSRYPFLEGGSRIYVMDADGSNIIQLTNRPITGDVKPFWSPDGTKIAFTRASGSNDYALWVMNADGSNQINLTNHPSRDGIIGGCWSPDGGKIAFTTDRDGGDVEIYVMDADGSNQINLTNRPGADGNPDWSPDGTKIVFSNALVDPPYSDIYVMDANGANQIRLTHPSPNYDDEPAWSPDGTKIAFTHTLVGSNKEIYVMDANGSNQFNLTNNSAGVDMMPDWQRAPQPAQALNLSTRMLVQTGDNVGIGGFIISGSAPKRVLVRAVGPELAQAGVPNPLADPVLELHGPPGFVTIINDNCVPSQFDPPPSFCPPGSLSAVIDATLNPGAYTAVVRGKNNTTGVALVEVYDFNQAAASKLANISTRAFVSTGDNIVIAGFILGGNSGDTRIAVRGIGPSLIGFGVPNPLANPTIELRDNNGVLLRANNDWQDNAAPPGPDPALIAAGLAPTNNLESAFVVTLPPGLYTALLAGVNNGTGVGVVEVYELGSPSGTPPPTPTPTPGTPTPSPTPPPTPSPTTSPGITPTPTPTPTSTPSPTPPSPTPTLSPGITPTPTPLTTATPPGACLNLTITINGAQEVPPNGSPATGTGFINIDTMANQLFYNITFSGLGSAETMAHIHGFAPPSVNAGIIHTLPLGNPKIGVFNYSQAQEADILNGLSYVNIHSVNFPNGEIRGQIAGSATPCPSPSSPPAMNKPSR